MTRKTKTKTALQSFGFLQWNDGTEMDCQGDVVECNGKQYKPEAILGFALQGYHVTAINDGSLFDDEVSWQIDCDNREAVANNTTEANLIIQSMLVMYAAIHKGLDAYTMGVFNRKANG